MPMRMMISVLLMAALAGWTEARGETAAESFQRGETLLAKGDFPTALESFATAARGDLDNREYLQHYAMVRRVVALRSQLAAEQDPNRWEQMARALRAFYHSERIYPELLKLDQQLHSRSKTADTAALLAETQLAMNQNEEAVKTLSPLEPAKGTAMTRALFGISLVRTGKAEDARRIAGELTLPADAGPSVKYAVARLHAATGDSATAAKLLTACFEGTLPSMLDDFKSHAKVCPEFAAMATKPEFAAALETKSKMPESKCSGGSGCAGCPMSGKCPHSQAKSQ
jgi:tetratricopeptide (TPR) repeat protein